MLIYAQGGRLGTDTGGIVLPDFFSDQGAIYTGRRPCLVWYRGDLYVIGYYTRPVVRFRQDGGGWRLAGIKPPTAGLSVVPGASSGGSNGGCLAAITFLHKVGPVVLAESNFGNVVDVGTLTGQGRVWSNIDGGSAESRVTHVRGYVSMDGAAFRAAWEAPYGITGYTENIRTSQLTYETNGYDQGIPPDTRYGCEWQGRMWYASNPKYPYRLWRSKAGQPQYVGPTSYLDTLGKEEITGIAKGRNELVVFCLRNSYLVRQFGSGEDDYIMERLDSDVGCISHFGIMEIHNKLWFPSEDGIWIYDGGFRYLMKEVQPLWRQDWITNKEDFLSGFALHDRINKVYMWVTRRPDREQFEGTGLGPGTVTYCGYYGEFEPSMAGSGLHPDWTLDMKYRFDSSGFYNEEGELVFGSCDGVIRKQDWSNGDDDGDVLDKELIVRTGAWLFNEPGDDSESGKQMLQVWSYVESELTGWRLYVRGGDEQAWQGILPDNEIAFWRASVAASYAAETRSLRARSTAVAPYSIVYVPKTVHYFLPQKTTGRGFTFEYRATAPIGLQYRGTGGMWAPGSTSRGMAAATNLSSLTATLEWSFDQVNWHPVAPGTPATISLVSLDPTATISYRYTFAFPAGAPTYPITVTMDHQTEPGYDHTIQVADIAEIVVYEADPYLIPSTGQYLISVADAAGIMATGFTVNIVLENPP
jgi:hypothetical protein